MRHTVTAQDIQDHAAHLCHQHLRLRDHGPTCTAGVLLTVLFYAAARLTSLSAACKALLGAPSYQASHDALLATLPHINELAAQFGVHPTLIHEWKKRLLAGAEAVFAHGAKADPGDAEAQKAELFEQIGRLKMELEWVKKKAAAFG